MMPSDRVRLARLRNPWLEIGLEGEACCSALLLWDVLWGGYGTLLQACYEQQSHTIDELRSLGDDVTSLRLGSDLVDPETGEVFGEIAESVHPRMLDRCERLGISSASMLVLDSLDVGDELLTATEVCLGQMSELQQMARHLFGPESEERSVAELLQKFLSELPMDAPPERWLRRHIRFRWQPPNPFARRALIPAIAELFRAHRETLIERVTPRG